MTPRYAIGYVFDERYRIGGVIGGGGFGTVYEAHDTRLNRAVALKILHRDAAGGAEYTPSTTARFKHEVAIVANLVNPHTVTLFEHGTSADGTLYMVFERVLGEDLATAVRREGRLTPDDTVRVIRQVAESLAEAHLSGLLHRDIKPENIRIRHWDPITVVVLEFGLARGADDGSPSITASGQLLGTSRYMAPEQLIGTPLTPATDVYGLGVVAFEMLVGSAALQGSVWGEQLERLQSGQLFSFEELQVLGPDLVTLLQRMTARAAQDRPRSAAAVVAALDALTNNMVAPNLLPDSSGFAPAPAPFPMRLAVVALGLIAIALALGAVVFAHVLQKRNQPPEPPPPRRVSRTGLVRPAEPPVPKPPVDVAVPPPPVVAAPDSGCGRPPPFQGLERLTSTFDLERESWLTHIPANYDADRKYPLVIVLHQTVEGPQRLLPATNFMKLADRDGAVLIAPDAHVIAAPWTRPDEVERMLQKVTATAQNLCIDLDRVYVVGHGQGGSLAFRLGCQDWIAAVATNSYRSARGEQFCDTPKPHMKLEPLHSDREPVEGGMGCGVTAHMSPLRSIAEAEELLRERNGCKPKRKEVFEYKDSKCFEWACDAPLQICHLEGGHPWPGTPRRVVVPLECDGAAPAFPIGERIWEFFGLSK